MTIILWLLVKQLFVFCLLTDITSRGVTAVLNSTCSLIVLSLVVLLQCLDSVGWAAGRASTVAFLTLKNYNSVII